MTMEVIFPFFIFILGLVVGSFVNALTYRLPLGISISNGRSKCPKCRKKIEWFDNIPLLSYILLQGRCRKCAKKISIRYPLIEATTAIIFTLIYFVNNSCITGMFTTSVYCNWQQALGIAALPYFLAVATLMIVVFIIDLEHQLIFDEMVFFGLFITFAALILTDKPDIYNHIAAGFTTALFFLLLNLITKGRGMGLGDAKLALFAGSILGLQASTTWLFLSFVTGAVVGVALIVFGKAEFGRNIPFGPFLVAGFFATLLWGEKLAGIIMPYLVL